VSSHQFTIVDNLGITLKVLAQTINFVVRTRTINFCPEGVGLSPHPTRVSVSVIHHGGSVTIPTLSTIKALIALSRCGTDVRTLRLSKIGVFLSLCDFGSVREFCTRTTVHHRSRHANDKISGKLAIGAKVITNHTVLASRQPVPNFGSHASHIRNVPQMRHGLNVTRIMPPKDIHRSRANRPSHSNRPTGIEERLIAAFHCCTDIWEDISTFASVTLGTDGISHIAKARTSDATPCINGIPVGRHLRRGRQSAHNLSGIAIDGDIRGVNGNLANLRKHHESTLSALSAIRVD